MFVCNCVCLFLPLIYDFLYADDLTLVVHSQSDKQHFMDSISMACSALDLAIHSKMPTVMYQTVPNKASTEPSIYVYCQ